jgi:hypothetical protein
MTLGPPTYIAECNRKFAQQKSTDTAPRAAGLSATRSSKAFSLCPSQRLMHIMPNLLASGAPVRIVLRAPKT